MGFDHNPYRHLELVARERPGDVERRLANIIMGRAPGAKTNLETHELQAAARILEAGYTPPRQAEVPTTWAWHCHNCGGEGSGPSDSLSMIVADWVAHLMASHNANPSDFDGWSDL